MYPGRGKNRVWVSEIGCLTSHATISQLYTSMWRHIDVQADWRRTYKLTRKGDWNWVVSLNKIHLWRHYIVLALHYFQGMACYRSATLLEVMDTRSFWNMFVFSIVIFRRSCISEVHSNNSCFSMNKKSRWWQLVSNPRRLRCGLRTFESSALPTELSQRWRIAAYFRFIKYITSRERGIYDI